MSLVNKIYESVERADERRVFNMWHASSIADCPRAHYFKRLGIKPTEEVGAGKILRWRVGHRVEEEIRDHLKSIYPLIISNKRYSDEALDLTGELDNYIEEEKTIVEIKSVHPFATKYLEKEGKPYLAHEYQQHAYSLLVDVEKIIYLYVGLDGWLMEFETEVKPDILDNVKKRLDILNEAWEKQEPPDCLCMKDKKPNTDHPLWGSAMKWCEYRVLDPKLKGDKIIDCCNINLIKEKPTGFKEEK